MSEHTLQLARSAYVAFNTDGLEGILDYLHPEIEWSMWEEFSRSPRVFHGHNGVREVLGVFTENYNDFRADPHELLDANPFVVAPVRLHGREKGSGEEQSFELVQVWRIDGELAVQLDVYANLEEARKAVEASGASISGASGSSK